MPEDVQMAITFVMSMARALGLSTFLVPGVEADDVIATLACKARQMGIRSWIVSNDNDFSQLLHGETVKILKPIVGFTGASASWDEFTEEKFRAKYSNVSPKRHIDMRALIGDKSDNLPGLAGFGEKTATKLIVEYGSLEDLIENADKIKGEKLSRTYVLPADQPDRFLPSSCA